MGWAQLTVWNGRRACMGRTIDELEAAIARCPEAGVANPTECRVRLAQRLQRVQTAREVLAVAPTDPWVRYLQAHLKGAIG
jgi:hypothetical protein